MICRPQSAPYGNIGETTVANSSWKKDELDVDAALTPAEIGAMVRCLLRHPATMRDAIRLGVDAGHFRADAVERPYYYLFAAASQLFQLHNALSSQMLITELSAWRDAGSLIISDDAFDGLTGPSGFIVEALRQNTEESREAGRAERQYAESILRRFIRARVIHTELQRTVNVGEGLVVRDLESKLASLTKRAQAAEYVGRELVNAAKMPNIGDPISMPQPRVPTTISWIDEYIGGFRPGEVIGLLAPFSGGKTTLLAFTAVRMAHQFYLTSPDKISVFIGYEDSADVMNPIFRSAATQIERRMFSGNVDLWSNMSDSNNLKPYDRELPMNRNGEIILGERERWMAAQPWVGEHLWYLDFSMNSETGGRGSGGVPEVIAALEQLADMTGKKIGFVGLDYIGILVERDVNSGRYGNKIATDNPHRFIKNAPDQMKTGVASPMNCVVMLAHQLAGNDIKNAPPSRYFDHLAAAGSKAFAENLHSCLCINKYDPKSFVSTLHWSKIRGNRPERATGLLKMHDTYVDVSLVTDEYVVSESGRCILRRGEVMPVRPEDVDTDRLRNRTRRIMPVDNFANEMMGE
jgi:hypothetical protein